MESIEAMRKWTTWCGFGAVQICEQGIPRGPKTKISEWNGNRRRGIVVMAGRARGIGKSNHAGGGGVAKARRENAAGGAFSRGLRHTIFKGWKKEG